MVDDTAVYQNGIQVGENLSFDDLDRIAADATVKL